jgi:hypothetical protein
MINKNENLSHLISNLEAMEFDRKSRRNAVIGSFIFLGKKAFYIGGGFLKLTDEVVYQGLKKEEALEAIQKELIDYPLRAIQNY